MLLLHSQIYKMSLHDKFSKLIEAQSLKKQIYLWRSVTIFDCKEPVTVQAIIQYIQSVQNLKLHFVE